MGRIESRFMAVLATLFAATAATSVAARQPTADERALVGHYYVGDGLDHRLCAVTLSFEPTVGGEVQASGCAKRVPELDQATGWWFDAEHGGPTFVDALHKVQAAFADSEGGLIANLGEDRTLTLEPYTQAFLAHPGAGLPGTWTYSNEGGDDPTGGCTVRFAKGGTAAVAARCPATLRAMGGGGWQATATAVTLAKGAKRLTLAWGASSDTLFLPGGAFRLVRER